MKITRRGVAISLGWLWLLDGLLQLQPRMFTSQFATQVIEPAAQGQPAVVANLMHFFVQIFLMNPTLWNSLIAVVQLALGLLILMKRTSRLALLASAVWGVFVWLAGEGLGGLASGQYVLLMGAPGAVLLYVILALGVLPSKNERRLAAWLLAVWTALWLAGAVFQLLPGQNNVSDLSSMIAGNVDGAPVWLATIDEQVGRTINSFGETTVPMAGMQMTPAQMAQMPTRPGSGAWFIITLAVLEAAIGLGVLIPGAARRWAVGSGIALSLAFWLVGQSLGEYYSGLATDPSTAPLFILLGVAVLGCTQWDQALVGSLARLENKLV